jgi:hypothetical protein
MTIRALLFLSCLLVSMTLTSVGFAQDGAPYAPHQHSRSELINFGTYDSPPLEFDLKVVDVKQQPDGPHLNFVVTVDDDFASVVEFFQNAHREQTPAARLAPGIMPSQSTRELLVVGHSTVDGASPWGFSLSGKQMSRRFSVDVSDEGGKTVLTMRNLVISQLFSGVVPARVGFKPAGAKPVGLLYN